MKAFVERLKQMTHDWEGFDSRASQKVIYVCSMDIVRKPHKQIGAEAYHLSMVKYKNNIWNI